MDRLDRWNTCCLPLFVMASCSDSAGPASFVVIAISKIELDKMGHLKNPEAPRPDLREVVSGLNDPSSYEDEEHHLGMVEEYGTPFESINFLLAQRDEDWLTARKHMVERWTSSSAKWRILLPSANKHAAALSAAHASQRGVQPLAQQPIAPPASQPLKFSRTHTSPSLTTTVSSYDPKAAIDICDAWVSLIRYCGTKQTNTRSLSSCYCRSSTDYVPDQWNSLAAGCTDVEIDCADKDDYLCNLQYHASESSSFCDINDGTTVRFHTKARSAVASSATVDPDSMENSDLNPGPDDSQPDAFGTDNEASEPIAAEPESTPSVSQSGTRDHTGYNFSSFCTDCAHLRLW